MNSEKIINFFLKKYVSVYLFVFNIILFFIVFFVARNMADTQAITATGLPEEDPRDVFVLYINYYTIYVFFSLILMVFDSITSFKNHLKFKGMLSFALVATTIIFLFFIHLVINPPQPVLVQ